MADVDVRRARREELPAVLELVSELDELQHPWRVFEPRPDLMDGVRERYLEALDEPESIVLVAVDGDEVVGTAYGHVTTPSSFSDEPAVELGGVMVAEMHRRRGVARALVAEVARFAQAAGAPRLVLKTFSPNEGALRAWEAMGFESRMVQLTAPAERFLD